MLNFCKIISIINYSHLHVAKPIFKSHLPYFVKNCSTLILPSPQKVLITGKPLPFYIIARAAWKFGQAVSVLQRLNSAVGICTMSWYFRQVVFNMSLSC